ncbi:MAG TPA: hypothetical protein VD927_01425 [Chryseosolibacter sp.]|nr:hypothetical protein [Chryseosolibacter sp.]
MKTQAIIFIICLLPPLASAQQPSGVDHKDKMKALSAWIGNWKGEGTIQTPTGETKTSMVDEKIENKLDGSVLLIEGIGKSNDASTNTESIVHHALAVLSYDNATGQYKMKSWLKDGKSTDAWFNITGDNNYQWGFDTPNGKIRYTIALNPSQKTWNEVGEFSRDGNQWRKFFEMNLAKVD